MAAGSVIAGTCLLATAAPADAAFTTSASCTPTTIVYPGPTTITCELQVTTGATEERFSVGLSRPFFGGLGPDGSGWNLAFVSGPTLVGPGTFGNGGTLIADPAQCSTLTPGLHGVFGSAPLSRGLTVPPNSATSIRYVLATSQPPWPNDSLAPSFELGTNVSPSGSATLGAPVSIPTPEPSRTGLSGVQISLQTKPASPVFGRVGTPKVKVDKRVKVFGSTSPPLDRQKLKILTRYLGDDRKRKEQPAESVRVTTNKAGRFAYNRWTLDEPGLYEVAASYRSQRSFLADDYTCSHAVEAGK